MGARAVSVDIDDGAAGTLAGQREFAYRPEDFQTIARLLEERTGIHLPAHKDQLVYSRLAKRLRALGLTSFAVYIQLIEGKDGGAELVRMVNALTTNLTRFFREGHHFTHLTSYLKSLAERRPRQRRLRIWSAGCSTGMEPYTIALAARAAIPDLASWDARILATDIDTDVLKVGATGRYDEEALADIPAEHRRYFSSTGRGEVELAPEIRNLIAFKPLNLIGPWPFKGPFDAIFCRNVAIYFTHDTQTRLFSRFHDMLADGAFLYVGHSETLNQLSDRFELLGQTTYRRR